nr:hypothetical protein [Tanacetum cinerariifolium]
SRSRGGCRAWARFLGGKISSGRNKSQELSDSDNIGDGGKIIGGAIGAGGGIGEVFSGEGGKYSGEARV